ncbi:TPA: hypothetical protein ACGC0K_003803, partial [Acinetobacter baumannii]
MYEKKHINFENLQPKDSYTSKNSYIPTIPARNPEVHGRKLLSEFQLTQQVFNETKTKILPYSQTSEGIYITLESDPESSLPLESIDNTDFILSNVRITKDKREEATIFIPEDKRRIFIKKITDYIDTIHKQKNPKNKKLINSIASIKLAELKNFWTDD